MTLVATPAAVGPPGGVSADSSYYEIFVDIAMSGNYVTNGDTLDLTGIAKRGGGRGSIIMVLFEPLAGYEFTYDKTAKKMLVYSTAATQLAAAAYPAGLTGVSVRAIIKTL